MKVADDRHGLGFEAGSFDLITFGQFADGVDADEGDARIGGERVFSDDIARILSAPNPPACGLTPRQLSILAEIVNGKANKHIAEAPRKFATPTRFARPLNQHFSCEPWTT